MTDTTYADAAVATPEPEPKPSRLRAAQAKADREQARAEAAKADAATDAEDFVTADERIVTFWRKYRGQEVKITSHSQRMERPNGAVEWTVHVTVTAGDHTVQASATRHSTDWNDIVADRPHDSAQTAALSRALRFLGIKPNARS
ncbi:hypothetical protein [Microbacterium trichothecenolyticum]|uniref:Uncharacterized protein n=1 Tax=Microbacterium trichothecenolyticum TaxID=69370 RepID=A0A0M2HL28_MICTR|nr:hypothetical protein [Microbacterium trichothecenolyticum]KJL45605.1 hypothetical protein RS82_00157 [Microbacterium trichothecenolyticum]